MGYVGFLFARCARTSRRRLNATRYSYRGSKILDRTHARQLLIVQCDQPRSAQRRVAVSRVDVVESAALQLVTCNL